jgi:hypothetical protein
MSYSIEPRKVAGVVTEANKALINRGFNHGEILVGLAELIGRVIVDVAQHAIQAEEMEKVVIDQLHNTIVVGSAAKGKSLIETP